MNDINNLYGQRYTLKIQVPEASHAVNFIDKWNHQDILNLSLNDLIKKKSILFKLDDVADNNAFNLVEAIMQYKDAAKKTENLLEKKGSIEKIQVGAENAIDGIKTLTNEIPIIIEKQIDKTMAVQNALKKFLEMAQEFVKKCSQVFMHDISLNKKIALSLSVVSVFFFYRLFVNYLKKYNVSDELKKNLDIDFLRYLNQEKFTGPIIEALKLDPYKTIYNTLSLDWMNKLNFDCVSSMNSNRMINLWGSFGSLFLSGGAFFYKEIYFGFLYLLKLTIYRYKTIEEAHNEDRAIIEADLHTQLKTLNENLIKIETRLFDLNNQKNEINNKISLMTEINCELEERKDKLKEATKDIKKYLKKMEEEIKEEKVNKIKKHVFNFFNTKIDKILAFNIQLEDRDLYHQKFNNLLEYIKKTDGNLVTEFKDTSSKIIELINSTYDLTNYYNDLAKKSSDSNNKLQNLTVLIILLSEKLKESFEQNNIEKEKIKKLLAQINPDSEVLKELLSKAQKEKLVAGAPSYDNFLQQMPKNNFESSSEIKEFSLEKKKFENKEQKIEDRMQKFKYKNLFFNTKQLSILISFPFFIWIVLKYMKYDTQIIDFFNDIFLNIKNKTNESCLLIFNNILLGLKKASSWFAPAIIPSICGGSLLIVYVLFIHYVKKYTIDDLKNDLYTKDRLLGISSYINKKLDESNIVTSSKIKKPLESIIEPEHIEDFSKKSYSDLEELFYRNLDIVLIDSCCPTITFNIKQDNDQKLFKFLMHCKEIHKNILEEASALEYLENINDLIKHIYIIPSINKFDNSKKKHVNHFKESQEGILLHLTTAITNIKDNKEYAKITDLLKFLGDIDDENKIAKYVEEQKQLDEKCNLSNKAETFYSIENCDSKIFNNDSMHKLKEEEI